MEKFGLITFSIVVLAKDNNPSLLNPDFLRYERIVPREFDVDENITTPAMSLVKYKNGLTINVESAKLQLLQIINDGFKSSIFIPGIAQKYIEALPHVRYGNVGINWDSYFINDDPAVWIRNNFIKKGRWDEKPYKVKDVLVRLAFNLEKAKCNLSLSPNIYQKSEDKEYNAVKISANYHHDVGDQHSNYKQAIEMIENWKNCETHFRTLISDFLKLEI